MSNFGLSPGKIYYNVCVVYQKINPLNILIVGAGAIGSVFGGLLAYIGHKVTLLGREKYMDAVRENGLRITGLFGDKIVKNIATAIAPEEIAQMPYDAILITVKSYDTENAAVSASPFVGQDSLVISLQNGLGNAEILLEKFGESRVLAGRVIFGAEIPHPGTVDVTVFAEPVMIGSPDNSIPMRRIENICSEIDLCGVPCKPTDEIRKFIWSKALYNCALNPLSAVLGVPYGKLLDTESSRETMRKVVAEIFAVAERLGVEMFWEKPEEYIEVLFGRLIPDTAAHHSSMLQDIRAGRRTEIDSLNGAIARMGAECGVECPANAELAEKIKRLEKLARN